MKPDDLKALGLSLSIVNPADLKPYPKNYNFHPETQIAELGKSLNMPWKQYKNAVIWQGFILCGHGLVEAAIKEQKTQIVVNDCSHLTQQEAEALLVSDNAIPFLAEPDMDELNDLLSGLDDIEIPGATKEWKESLDLKNVPSILPDDIDDLPEVQGDPITRMGDLWIVGKHRILCGDSTKREDVERLMGGEKAELCFTSPPYNSAIGGIKSDYYGKQERFYLDKQIDKKTKSEWISFCDIIMNRFHEIQKDQESVLAWNVMYNANMRDAYGLQVFGKGHPFTVKETIAWHKKNGFNICTKGILSRNWELIFILSEGETYFTTQAENEARYSMIEFPTVGIQKKSIHNAIFPVALAQKMIEWFSLKQAIIFDPFLGSGTTLVACESTGRQCRALEIFSKYVDICLLRYMTVFNRTDAFLLDGDQRIPYETVKQTRLLS
jgi:DNA modification methylase